MSENKQQLLYESLCSFYEDELTRTELNEVLYELNSRNGKGRFVQQISKWLLLNQLSADSLMKELATYESAELRRILLHMSGLRQADTERCGMDLFHVQGTKSNGNAILPRLNNYQKAVLAAAWLDAPVSGFLGGKLPAPKEESAWYHHVDLVENSKETFTPLAYQFGYFQHGRIALDDLKRIEVGATALWLEDGFTQVTFTVNKQLNDVDEWEFRLLKFGALRQLVGPSIYIASRSVLHEAHPRTYRMIWPARAKNLWQSRHGFYLSPMQRVRIYSRIFTPVTYEVSFFNGTAGALPLTIKYPQKRNREIVNAFTGIGLLTDTVKKRKRQLKHS